MTGFRNDLRDTYQYPPPFFIPQAVGEATTYGTESSLDCCLASNAPRPVAVLAAQPPYTHLERPERLAPGASTEAGLPRAE